MSKENSEKCRCDGVIDKSFCQCKCYGCLSQMGCDNDNSSRNENYGLFIEVENCMPCSFGVGVHMIEESGEDLGEYDAWEMRYYQP